MRNCLVNEKGNVYDYNNEQTDRATLQRYNNCNKPGYNVYICKNDEEMTNVYSCN